jgi:hypothetical protein
MPLRINAATGLIVRNNGTPWRPSHQGLLSRRHPHPRRRNEVMISRANAARIIAIRRRIQRLENRANALGVNLNLNSNANNNYNIHNQNPIMRNIARERADIGLAWNGLGHNLMTRYGNNVTFGHAAVRAAERNARRTQERLLRRAGRRIVHRFIPGRRRAVYLTASLRRLGFDPLVRLTALRQYIRSARGRLA